MGVVSGAPEAGSDLSALPVCPAFVPFGEITLDRVVGDFPDELVYVAFVGAFGLWIKSSNLLDGPWDWVIQRDGHPVDFGGPFRLRAYAVADLLAHAEREGVEGLSVESDLSLVVEAEDPSRPTAPAPVACNTASAAGPDWEDPEIMKCALDLAIATLRKVRSRYTAPTSPEPP